MGTLEQNRKVELTFTVGNNNSEYAFSKTTYIDDKPVSTVSIFPEDGGYKVAKTTYKNGDDKPTIEIGKKVHIPAEFADMVIDFTKNTEVTKIKITEKNKEDVYVDNKGYDPSSEVDAGKNRIFDKVVPFSLKAIEGGIEVISNQMPISSKVENKNNTVDDIAKTIASAWKDDGNTPEAVDVAKKSKYRV